MNIRFIILLAFILANNLVGTQAQTSLKNFDTFFHKKTLRLDFHQAGNATSGAFYLYQLKEQEFWGGSQINLIDTMGYGDYKLSVYDLKSKKLIYSRGFSSLFCEWQDTHEAKETNKSFEICLPIPYPKKNITVEIQKKDKSNKWHTEFKSKIEVNSYQIIKENTYNFNVEKIHGKYEANKSLDIVIVAEGYTKSEMKKFKKDANRFSKELFEVQPFKRYKDHINIYRIDAISEASGTDYPGKGIWNKTILNSHFDTFGSERYLTTQSIFKLNDIASLAPYDQIYILVNTEKYGGGGIFNFYNLTSSDHKLSGKVFTHEFGHAFGALADEYAYAGSSDDIRYDYSVEISAPNLTTLVEFEKKWKDMVNPKTPIPTPNDKKYHDKIGAFEGGGYVLKKVYRPAFDCKMRSNTLNTFCPVCEKSLEQMLLFYIK